jgi:hypothetical protein
LHLNRVEELALVTSDHPEVVNASRHSAIGQKWRFPGRREDSGKKATSGRFATESE